MLYRSQKSFYTIKGIMYVHISISDKIAILGFNAILEKKTPGLKKSRKNIFYHSFFFIFQPMDSLEPASSMPSSMPSSASPGKKQNYLLNGNHI